MAKWRRHSEEFKRAAVEKMRTCDNIRALARELEIDRKTLYSWKWQFEGRPGRSRGRSADSSETAEERRMKKLRDENLRLKQALADRSLELDFFKSALRRIEDGQRNNSSSGASAFTPKSRRGRSGKAN